MTAPYGSWPTPVTSELVVTAAVRLDEVRPDGSSDGAVIWAEGRAAEGGRTQLVRRTPDGTVTDLLPDGANVRTAVHEYGGGAWWTHTGSPGAVWYVEWVDQRLRRLEVSGDQTDEPMLLTPESTVPRGDRYADGDVAPDGTWLVCVRERHPSEGCPATEVVNEVVRCDARAPSEPQVLVSGPDFVAAPRISPDATRLAWLSWDHPSMPWDDVVLTVRDLASGTETVVAGGPGESVTEPAWQGGEHADRGSLTFLSDRTGWWNLYRWTEAGVEPLVLMEAEIGVPGWQLGGSRYAVLDGGDVVFARSSEGFDALVVRAVDGTLTELGTGFSAIRSVRADGPGSVVCVAGSPTAEPGVHVVTAHGAHKFESRYLDGLVGPYPEAREVYVERSPLTHVERFSPLIVLQGDEDAIVPPNQSEMIVSALRARGVPVAYLLFPGEQHGFRRASTIRRALDAEVAFYARMFSFALPPEEDIAPVVIDNLG